MKMKMKSTQHLTHTSLDVYALAVGMLRQAHHPSSALRECSPLTPITELCCITHAEKREDTKSECIVQKHLGIIPVRLSFSPHCKAKYYFPLQAIWSHCNEIVGHNIGHMWSMPSYDQVYLGHSLACLGHRL